MSQLVNAEVNSGNRKAVLAKLREGGRVRSFGGFAWLPIDKKASSFSSKNLRNFFSSCRVVAE